MRTLASVLIANARTEQAQSHAGSVRFAVVVCVACAGALVAAGMLLWLAAVFSDASGGVSATPVSEVCALPNASGVDCACPQAGELLTTWLETEPNSSRTALRFVNLELGPDGGASEPVSRTIVESERVVANWADFPRVLALTEVDWIVCFLERLGEGKYDYGVRITATRDAGATWSEPRWLHEHVGPGEHGFVSLARVDERTALAVWLDGRDLRETENGPMGATGLYARRVALDGELGSERLLDPRVCDCCQTDVVVLGDGSALVAYRDRTEDEIRDVKVLRLTDDAARPVFDSLERFRFEGCPVNGPAIAARGDQVALVWFAPELAGGGRVRMVTSHDRGATFQAATTLDDDALGRVEVGFRAGRGLAIAIEAVAVWLDDAGPRREWRFAVFQPSTHASPLARVVEFGELGPTRDGRESGFPRAVVLNQTFIASSVVEPGRSVLWRLGD